MSSTDLNDRLRHSAIEFITPTQRHEGRDVEILANRQRLYKQAQERNPLRWSGKTRSWIRPVQVWLNPKMKTDKPDEELKEAA